MSRISKRVDLVAYIIIAVIVFMSVMYVYIASIQKKRDFYKQYNEKIFKLKILNNKLDSFILSESRFKSYDDIVSVVKMFEKHLYELKHSFIYGEFENDLQKSMEHIENSFAKKRDIVERIKSYKSSVFYSFAYAIQLNNSIKKIYVDEEIHALMTKVLFSLFQLYMGYEIDSSYVKTDIEKLSYKLKRNKSIELQYFILHTKTLNRNISLINSSTASYLKIPLDIDIDKFQQIFDKNIKKISNLRHTIYNTMFLFALFLLIILLVNYIKSIKLKRELVSFRYAVENSDDSVVITDKERKITYVNEAFTKVTGYTKDEALGKNPSILKSGEMPEEFYKNMNDILDSGKKWSGEFINKDSRGRIYYERASITPMFQDDKLDGYLAIKLNISEYIKEKRKVEFLAYHDALTELPNRRMMKEVIEKRIEEAKKSDLHVELLFMDLDGFKAINDTLGHNIGDKFLQEVSNRLRNYIGDENILFRTGGDEFALLICYSDSKSPSEDIASKIIDIINKPVYFDENELIVGISIGIAKLDEITDDVISLLRHADIAMYEAKQTGKNRFCHFELELFRSIEKRMNIKQALNSAIKQDEFYVVYQPKYFLDSKKLKGVEALIRWKSSKFGMVSPDYFIPIAEETKIIHDIGVFVFRQACEDFMEMKDLKFISINLSAAQFMNKDLLNRFKNIVIDTGIEPYCIGLEITETYIMKNIEEAIVIMKEMKKFGFRIVIDDFGTGYSSMAYLKKLPIDVLKIDKSFVDDICVDSSDVKIVKAILSIAKSFNYDIVAEGIETKEQEDKLMELGVKVGQGYYFSKPKRKEELF